MWVLLRIFFKSSLSQLVLRYSFLLPFKHHFYIRSLSIWLVDGGSLGTALNFPTGIHLISLSFREMLLHFDVYFGVWKWSRVEEIDKNCPKMNESLCHRNLVSSVASRQYKCYTYGISDFKELDFLDRACFKVWWMLCK